MRLLVLFVLLLLPFAAGQQTTILPEPREYPPCDLPEPILFAELPAAIENLAFDGAGRMFLTAFGEGLFVVDVNGSVTHVASDERARPPTAALLDDPNAFMGVDVGPDGALYVSEGLSIVAPVDARVLRFPVAGEPAFEIHADGFDGANGLAVTPDGVVYLVHGFRNEIWRITAAGEWTEWTQVPTANGLVEHPDGERLVVTQVVDGATTILAIDLADPTRREVLFTFAAAPSASGPTLPGLDKPIHAKGIDDLVVAPDGRIYGAAHLRQQFLRADPATGEACAFLDKSAERGAGPTGGEPTSARIAEGFGDWDGWLFGVNNAGEVWAVDIRATDGATDEDSRETPAPTASQDTPLPVWGALAALAFAARRLTSSSR